MYQPPDEIGESIHQLKGVSYQIYIVSYITKILLARTTSFF